MERYRDEVAAQRSQALADLDREAQEVDLLRTALVQLIAVDALRVWGDGRWETDKKRHPGAVFTPSQVEAIDRAKQVVSDRNAALQTVREAPEMLTAERVARGLGAVPLEALDAEAQERGHVRLAQAAVVGNRRRRSDGDPECPWPDGLCTCNAARMHRPPRDPRVPEARQEALDEVDVHVTLADAATVVRTVRDDLLNPDRPLSLGALALLLGSVLPRIEYQAGCEAAVYDALHDVVLRHAIAEVVAGNHFSTNEETADAVLDALRSHLPKLTKETP
jgi:hypothetical protein